MDRQSVDYMRPHLGSIRNSIQLQTTKWMFNDNSSSYQVFKSYGISLLCDKLKCDYAWKRDCIPTR